MEFGSTTPIYTQIAEELRYEILIGALNEEDQVMPTTKYTITYRINSATVAKAFIALVDEGLFVKKRSVGIFAVASVHGRLRTTGQARFIQNFLPPAAEEAPALRLTPNDLIDAAHTHVQSAETHTKEY